MYHNVTKSYINNRGVYQMSSRLGRWFYWKSVRKCISLTKTWKPFTKLHLHTASFQIENRKGLTLELVAFQNVTKELIC